MKLPLVVFALVYPMRSHIHALNMARKWLAERKIWFNQSTVGWFVEVLNPIGNFIWLIKAKFLFILVRN